MPKEIIIPRLGWSMEEGVFGEWLKSPGEYVRAGEMVFLLEGEKAAHEIESFDSGILCVPEGAPQSGDTVKVGQVIGLLLAEGELAPASLGVRSLSPPKGSADPAAPTRVPTPKATVLPSGASPMTRPAGPAARRLARQLGIDLNAVHTPDPTGRVLCEDVERAAAARACETSGMGGSPPVATPRARRRARELGIDWTRLAGTGREGRIRERDVLAGRSMATLSATADGQAEPAPTAAGKYSPASKLRLILAQRMVAGIHQAAPVTLTTKVDASALVGVRAGLKAIADDEIVPSYNDLLIKLTAMTLRELPELNACWHRDGIWAYEAVNVAMAVHTEAGLLAPVIRNADRLTVAQIAGQTRQLIELARSGRLTEAQLAGGTFTVSNLGMFGIDAFTPILNLPQAAILGIGRIVDEPVVRNGHLEIGTTLTLSLTFDHRVVDGAPAARWLQHLVQKILAPEPALPIP